MPANYAEVLTSSWTVPVETDADRLELARLGAQELAARIKRQRTEPAYTPLMGAAAAAPAEQPYHPARPTTPTPPSSPLAADWRGAVSSTGAATFTNIFTQAALPTKPIPPARGVKPQVVYIFDLDETLIQFNRLLVGDFVPKVGVAES